jgi:hypothetical protein
LKKYIVRSYREKLSLTRELALIQEEKSFKGLLEELFNLINK